MSNRLLQLPGVCFVLYFLQIPKSPDDVNLRNPDDMSYVFSGAYTPLLCRIIEQVLAAIRLLLPPLCLSV